jgi:hypothetical protein
LLAIVLLHLLHFVRRRTTPHLPIQRTGRAGFENNADFGDRVQADKEAEYQLANKADVAMYQPPAKKEDMTYPGSAQPTQG